MYEYASIWHGRLVFVPNQSFVSKHIKFSHSTDFEKC